MTVILRRLRETSPWSRNSESGLIHHYINPLWQKKTSFVTAKMLVTHWRDCLDKLRVFLVFIEFIILICILIARQRRIHLYPAPPTALQPPPQSQPWILQRQEKGCYSNLLADLIYTDIPGYQNFVRMPPAFFTSSRNTYTTTSRSQSPISGSH